MMCSSAEFPFVPRCPIREILSGTNVHMAAYAIAYCVNRADRSHVLLLENDSDSELGFLCCDVFFRFHSGFLDLITQPFYIRQAENIMETNHLSHRAVIFPVLLHALIAVVPVDEHEIERCIPFHPLHGCLIVAVPDE